MKRIIGIVVLCMLIGTGLGITLSRADDLPPGVVAVDGGEGTSCADGSPYRFFSREGQGDALLIYFEGGGACWDGSTCNPRAGTYKKAPDDLLRLYGGGIFASRPENPFQDYDIVLVSYCTGDVHMGDAVQEYTYQGRTFTIAHKGYPNAQRALAWAFEKYPSPSRIFITGSSAGSYGAIFHASTILEHYQGVPAAHLGDSGVGVIGDGWEGLSRWGVYDILRTHWKEFKSLTEADFGINQLYIVTAKRFPEVTFSQYTTKGDRVQAFFYELMGGTDWINHMESQLQALKDALPNFRAFVAGGDLHTILNLPQFYTYQSEGIPLRDWVEALSKGEPVKSLHCTNCAVPELVN